MEQQRKTALVVGLSNEHSLGWHIANGLVQADYQVILAVKDQRQLRRVNRLAQPLSAPVIVCDVRDDQAISGMFNQIAGDYRQLDCVVHAVAFADVADLEGCYVDTPRQRFLECIDVSVYSLVALAKQAAALMPEGGNILTLSFHGAQKVIKNYNVMGVAKAALESSVRYLAADLGQQKIRVNGISAGAIKTVSAMAMPRFNDKLEKSARYAPLGENVDGNDVAQLAVFLCSDAARHITGGIHYVDSGLHILGG